MLKHLHSWLVVTVVSTVALGLLAALGLGLYLISHALYAGVGLMI